MKIFTLVLILGFFLSLSQVSVAEAPEPVPVQRPISEYTVEEQISFYTSLFGSDPDVVYSTGLCESEGTFGYVKGDLRDGVYHSFGPFQYFKDTWNRYANLYRETFQVSEEFDIESIQDQVKLTSWVFSLRESAKREWTTYRAIKNGGTYHFYSKFHKREFTISCPLKKIPTGSTIVIGS